jgi:hypothetical protein
VLHFSIDDLQNFTVLFTPNSCIDFSIQLCGALSGAFDSQSILCLNFFFSSCSSQILLLISTVDPYILNCQSDILFALLVLNYVLPN